MLVLKPRRRYVFAPWAKAVALLIATGFAPASARGYTEPRTYFEDAQRGGAGGRWFTGSPAEGYGCSVCHTGPGREPLEITGLPAEGYVPGESYALRVAWPGFAERAAAIREAGTGPASMGLVAEFTTETGLGAGNLEVAPAGEAAPGELCVLPPDVQGTQLFVVRPGEPTEEQLLRCEASELGQRCLAAVLSCGAEELRARWTAPEQWQGPIWFSLGFVATDLVSGDPGRDRVTEVQYVLRPAASGAALHESELQPSHGCSVATRGNGAAYPLPLMLVSALLLLWRVRGCWKVAVQLSAATLALPLLASLGACTERAAPNFSGGASDEHPLAGLHTPGSKIGYRPPPPGAEEEAMDGGTGLSESERREIEDTLMQAGLEDRCEGTSGSPGTDGELKVKFQTASYGGFYAPENCGAVWIEDEEENYVATPMIWAKLRIRNLFLWNALRCPADSPDVVSSATLPDHTTKHEATWDGRDRDGNVVPDGRYVLNIEVTEDEFDFGRRGQFAFRKGPEMMAWTPEDQEAVINVEMTFTPASEMP